MNRTMGRFGILTVALVLAWLAVALGSGTTASTVLTAKGAGIAGSEYQAPCPPHEHETDQAIPNSALGTEEQCKARLGKDGDEYCSDVFLAL